MNLNLRSQETLDIGRLRVISASSSLELENIEDSDEGLLLRDPPRSVTSARPSTTQPSPVDDRPVISPIPSPSPFPCPSPFPLPSPLQSIPLNQPATSCTSPTYCTHCLHPREFCPSGSTYSPYEVDFPDSRAGYDGAALAQGQLGGDWRPMRPGYALPPDADYPSLQAVKRAAELENGVDMESGLRLAIPIMPRPLAIACFVLNVLWPGLGTLIAGLSVLCCSRPRFPYTSRSSVVWSNIWVSFLQLMTTGLLLLGWIWSIAWGASFVSVSRQYASVDLRSGHTIDGTPSGPITEPPSENPSSIPDSSTTVTTTTAPTSTSMSPAQPTASSLPPSSINHDSLVQPSIIFIHQSPIIARAPTTTTTRCPWSQGNQSAVSPEVTSSRTNRRSRRRSWSVYPEMLLAPGALETIVVRNGTFFVRDASLTVGGRNGQQQQTTDLTTIDHFAPKVSITRTTSHQ